MTNVIPFDRKNHMTAPPAVEPNDMTDMVEARHPFSFDMIQPESGGLVLIDACVPMALAVQFMELMTRFREEADAPANSNKRRSRKKVAASA